MRYPILLLAGLTLSAHAQIVSPGAEGAVTRAETLYDCGNYAGALDQLSSVSDVPSPLVVRHKLLKARCLYASGDYIAAREEYLGAARVEPWSADAVEASAGAADCLFARGLYKEALGEYSSLAVEQLAPSKAAAVFYNSGVCAFEEGEVRAAARYFADAAKDGSTRSAANFYLGVIAFNEGDYGKARNYFNLTNQGVEPGRRSPYYLAQIEYGQGAWAKALTLARQVLKAGQAPEQAEMQRVAGESLCRLGQNSEGLEYLRKYLKSTSKPALTALYLVGVDDFENGDYSEAVEHLRPVCDSEDPKAAQSAYLFIGQAQLHQGDSDAALMSFEKALGIDGGDTDAEEAAYYNYAVAKLEGASIPFKSSAGILEEFLRRYPSGPYSQRVSEYLAGGYLADKDYARAIERIDKVAHPSDAMLKTKLQALYALAWTDYRSGDYDSALANLNKAGEYTGFDRGTGMEVDLLKAETLLRRGDSKDAAKLFRSYLDKAPREAVNRPVASYGLGYALYNQKDIQGAKRAFTDALHGLEGAVRSDIYNRLGDLSQASGDWGAAASYYEKSAQTSPSASDYSALQMARMKGYQRDYQGKLDALDAFARDHAGSPLMPDALLETTQAQISLGRNGDAVATYRRLIDGYPSTSQGRRGYLEMAMTLLDMERRDEALDAYRSVISLYPSSEEAVQATALLKNLYTSDGRASDYIEFINSVDNAPKIDAAEAENLSYSSAMSVYRSKHDTSQIEAFVDRYRESGRRAELMGVLLEDAVGKDDKAKALGIAEEIVSAYPDSRVAERAMLVKARDLYDRGAIPEALEMYRTLEPRSSDQATAVAARMGVMRAARDMGDYKLAAEEADALMNSSATKDYNEAEVKFTKACALEANGDVDGAIELWRSNSKNTSELYGAKSAYRAAEALYESGKTKEALSATQKFVKSGSKQRYWVARGFILLSDIYKAKGNNYEAKQYLEALRDNYPGDETDIKMMIESRLGE